MDKKKKKEKRESNNKKKNKSGENPATKQHTHKIIVLRTRHSTTVLRGVCREKLLTATVCKEQNSIIGRADK